MLCARQIDCLLCQRTWFAAILLWLSGGPASHTGVCQTLPSAGLPKLGLLAGLWMTAWKPLAYPGHSLGSLPPRRALLSTEKQCSSEQKQNQTLLRWSGKNLTLAERGRSQDTGPALLTGGGPELGQVLTVKHGMLTSSPSITSISA